MALDKLTKVQSVGISSFIQVVGVLTATSFVGSGANLTNLPAQVTIANNSDNRVITGGSGVNLNGEANLTFNGSKLVLAANSTAYDAFQVGDGLFIGNTTNNVSAAIFHQGGGADLEIGSQDMITFTTGSTAGNATERLRITSAGDIGLGTASPRSITNFGSFAINGTAGAFTDYFLNGTRTGTTAVDSNGFTSEAVGSSTPFRVITNGSERFRIHSSGVPQFTTTGTQYAAASVPAFVVNSNGDHALVLNNQNTTDPRGLFIYQNQDVNNGTSYFWRARAGGTDRAHLYSNGTLQLHSGNLKVASGYGIDFSANSNASGMTSEVLDDYEEGAFDPRLRFGTSTEIGTFNTQSKAEYVKIGKIVHVSGWARYDSVNTSNSGILHMDLPFTVDEYGMPHNYVYPGSVVLTHTDLQQKGIHVWCGNAGAARTRFGFYNSSSGSTDYIENGDLAGWNGNTRNLHFNFSYQTND